MNDKELADLLVDALPDVVQGHGHGHPLNAPWPRSFMEYTVRGWPGVMPAVSFVKDWRVAGECLKRWPTTINTERLEMTLDEMLRDPRAISEAFVTAVANDQ